MNGGGTEGQRTALRYVLTAPRRATLGSRTGSICVIFTSLSLRVEDQDRQMVHGDGDSAALMDLMGEEGEGPACVTGPLVTAFIFLFSPTYRLIFSVI